MIVYAPRFIFEMLWQRKVQQWIICLPGPYIEAMKTTAIQELATRESDTEDKEEERRPRRRAIPQLRRHPLRVVDQGSTAIPSSADILAHNRHRERV